jgi:hypothetical protein
MDMKPFFNWYEMTIRQRWLFSILILGMLFGTIGLITIQHLDKRSLGWIVLFQICILAGFIQSKRKERFVTITLIGLALVNVLVWSLYHYHLVSR